MPHQKVLRKNPFPEGPEKISVILPFFHCFLRKNVVFFQPLGFAKLAFKPFKTENE